MSSAETIVRVDGLVKDFRPGFGLRRKRVLHGISFEVQRGELFGFIGPNGAGKTTTLKVLMGLIRASAGRAEVLGCDVRQTEFRRHVGFAPESPYFYDFLSGRETLAFYARLCGVPAGERERRIDAVLAQVGLAHAADARLRTYSKGMLQRIGIAQALVHDPGVLFLDEPMSGLDPVGRKEIRDLIVRLNHEGKTIFMNTHILSDVEMICDRVAIIVAGRIAYQGALDGVDDAHKQYDATFSGLPPDFAEEIDAQRPGALRGRGDRITVRVSEKEVNELVQAALLRGARLEELVRHRDDLESVFLRAVAEQKNAEARS
jgi:ABC-2 type transport system ATP-binding protein